MIRVSFQKKGELLVGVVAQGHAGWEKAGQDIVCAAVTALLRSAARALARRYPGEINFGAGQPGQLELHCEATEEWSRGVWTMLETGLRDIEKEFPTALRIEDRI